MVAASGVPLDEVTPLEPTPAPSASLPRRAHGDGATESGGSSPSRGGEHAAGASRAVRNAARLAARRRRRALTTALQRACADHDAALASAFEAWDAAVEADSTLPATALLLLGLAVLASRRPSQPGWAWWAVRVSGAVSPVAWAAVRRRFAGAGRAVLGLEAGHAFTLGNRVHISAELAERAARAAAAAGVFGTPATTAGNAAARSVAALGATAERCEAALSGSHFESRERAARACIAAELVYVVVTSAARTKRALSSLGGIDGGVTGCGGALDDLLGEGAGGRDAIVSSVAEATDLDSWVARSRLAIQSVLAMPKRSRR